MGAVSLLLASAYYVFYPTLTGSRYVVTWKSDTGRQLSALGSTVIILLILLILLTAIKRASIREAVKVFKNSWLIERERAKLAAAEDQTDPSDFTSVWRRTQKRMDLYHKVATTQADQSYQNGQRAITVGFLLLVCIAISSLFIGNTTGALTTASIGVAGAALTGYLTRTFLRVHESASRQLRSYFEEPLRLSQQLSAERLINLINDEEKRNDAIIGYLGASQGGNLQVDSETP